MADPTMSLVYPEAGKWGAPNDLRIMVLRTYEIDKNSYAKIEECTWKAWIFDTSVAAVPRSERILSFTASVRGAPPTLVIYPPWEGSYVLRGRFGQPRTIGSEIEPVYPHVIVQLHRTEALISGCPFLLEATYESTTHQFPFGVGPREAYGWPRNLENVRISGQSLPAPLNKLAEHFQVIGRDERDLSGSVHKINMATAGTAANLAGGRVLGSAVLSGSLVTTDRKSIDIEDPTTWGEIGDEGPR